MDQIIISANFMHTDKDDLQHEFYEQLRQWRRKNGENYTLHGALNALKAAQEKLCQPDFPTASSSGYYMGYHMIKNIMEMLDDLVGDNKAKPSDIQPQLLEFILALIMSGPNSSHIEFYVMLRGEEDFKEYFQSLQGSNLTRVITSLKRDYSTAEPGLEWELYCNRHFEKFCRIMLDNFSNEQFLEGHRQFLDLYMYLDTSFFESNKEVRKAMHHFAYLIELKYDRNPFKGFQDAGLLKLHLSTISKIILMPDFPQSKDVEENMKDILSDILKTVSEEELLSEMYEDIMDLALNISTEKDGCKETMPHFEVIGYFFFHIKETGVQHNEALFDGLVRKFINVLDNFGDERYLMLRFVSPIVCDCLKISMGGSDDQVAQWIMMIKALLKHSIPHCVKAAYEALREKEKLIKWKKYPEEVKQIYELLSKITYPTWLAEEEFKQGMKNLEDLVGKFFEEVKKVRLAQELAEPTVQFVFHCLEMRTEEFYSLGQAVARNLDLNPKKDKALIVQIIQQLTVMLADETYNWDDDDMHCLHSVAGELISKALSSVKDGKIFTWEEYDALISLTKLCQTSIDLSDHEARVSVFFMIYITVSTQVMQWLQAMNEMQRVSPLVPGILDMLDSEVKEIQDTAAREVGMLSHFSNLLAPHLDRLLRRFLESEQENILWSITNCYEHNPGLMVKYFDKMFEHVDSGNATIHNHMMQLMQKVAKYQPDLFSEDKVAVLVREAKQDKSLQMVILMALEEIAKRRTEKIASHVDELMAPGVWQSNSMYFICRILQYYGLQSEEKADKVVTFLVGLAQKSSEQSVVITALSAARLIGYRYRGAIAKHRKTFEKMRDEMNNDDHSVCASILDMLDGKSVEKVAEELKALQEDVADLEIRMFATETEVSEVKDAVQHQGEDLENVKNEVTEQGQRLDKVEETVEETVAKVEEIDSKTLSHAPFWSRDVSKLLNPEAEHDWRLLSSRLGYSKDDIRGWAQQADPCMAMLNEWYATHKTREATHAVLTVLQDMNREEAAIIVENAMKNAEAVVEDEEYEYATPPDVFISYQWSHQNEVKLLRQHLEMAGYSCWMDVGQMGGGDKLFEKIDSGIRAAKVVISCVTEKYTKSPNCNREVNLSVSLGKPIIPLLMEKTTWPPPGSMGPIFSEYLFIRFFQRVGEETNDQRYWPPDRFQELLMQLSMNNITPDQQAVQPEYKDWWIPKIEEVIVDKNRARGHSNVAATSNSLSSSGNEEAGTSPDIFISYQWGTQPQIVRLFQKLTSLGYTCWLDIMQMGGGDSLYDKIDRGLRGCRVVVSCITPKYALSGNCRREVSLADALHKPLIPILLETMTWPPPGPMGPILTQLLYINFTNMQDDWAEPKFDELITMINQHMPNIAAASPEKVSTAEKQENSSHASSPKKAGLSSAVPEDSSTTEEQEHLSPTSSPKKIPEDCSSTSPSGPKHGSSSPEHSANHPSSQKSNDSSSYTETKDNPSTVTNGNAQPEDTEPDYVPAATSSGHTTPPPAVAHSSLKKIEWNTGAGSSEGHHGHKKIASIASSTPSDDLHDLIHTAGQSQRKSQPVGLVRAQSSCCSVM